MIGSGKLLSEHGGKILYNGTHMEAFIPDEYFAKNLAEEIGMGYLIFGNFITYHYFTKDANRADAQEASFEFPMKFHTFPDEVTVEKLDIGSGEQKYHVLHYYTGAVVFETTDIISNSDNAEFFMTLMMEGKLDNMEYDRMPNMLNICKIYNRVNLMVPAMYEETLISEYYRDINNINRPARFTAKSKGTRVRGITLREKAAFTSTFSAITFEDKISMLTISDNAKREGRKEIISEVEKVSLGLI